MYFSQPVLLYFYLPVSTFNHQYFLLLLSYFWGHYLYFLLLKSNDHNPVCATFYLYCPNSFWGADPQKLSVPIDLKGDLYSS